MIFHLICGLGVAFIQLTNAKVAILCDNGEIKQVTRHFRFSSLPRGLKDHWALKLNSSGRQRAVCGGQQTTIGNSCKTENNFCTELLGCSGLVLLSL